MLSGAWSVEPSHRVGAFHLGMGVNEALAVVQKMGSLDFAEFNFDEQRPFAADLVLRLPSWGLQLCFDPYQQDLRLISVRLLPEDAGVSEPEAPEASLLPELTYSGQTLGNPPNLREVYQMFGPTWIGDFRREKAAYLLRYPGLAFEFPLPEDMVDKLAAKGEHPMDLAGRPTPSACWMWVYAAQASLQSPRSVVPIEAVQVSPGKGIRLQGRKLLFGAMPQDVVSDFGPPQQVCVKDVDAFRIHSRTPRSPNLDYYYNYFYLGLDALFDGQTHLLQKIVLHTNPPTHERFSRYTRCFFQLQLQEESGESEVADDAQGQKQRKLAEAEPTSDEGDGEAAAASPRVSVPEDTVPPQVPGRRPTVDVRWQWQDIEEALRTAGLAKSKPLVMDQSRYTSFGSTYFYGFPGVVFEVMQNSYLASLTLFSVPSFELPGAFKRL